MENEKRLASIYVRVSTQYQSSEGLSLDAQESVCKEALLKEGYQIFKIVRDEGKSGGSLNRNGIKEIINSIVNKKINALYVVSSDRLARNTGDDIYIRQLCRENNVNLRCLNQPDMEDNAMTRMVNTVFASFNQMQRDITSEKVTMTMENKGNLGYFPALAPIGYLNVKNPDRSVEKAGQKIIIKDPIKAPLVKTAFEMFATGNFNVFDITDITYEKGLKTKYGKKLSYSRMYEILRNKVYIGEVHWGNVHIKEGKHEPIIERDLFDRVQRLLTTKGLHSCRRRKYQWLLSGLLTCSVHGCKYTAEWHLNKGIAYYHCTHRHGCSKYIEMKKMENMVADKFKDLEFSDKFLNTLINKIKSVFFERRKLFEDKRKGFMNQKTAYELKRKTAEDKLFSNVISDTDFKRVKEEINNEIEKIDSRILDLEKERGLNIDIAEQVFNLTKNIYDTFITSNPKVQRQLLAFFWEKFEVDNGVIIKSVPSPLFRELLRLEQVFYKNTEIQKASKIKGFSEVINLYELSSR